MWKRWWARPKGWGKKVFKTGLGLSPYAVGLGLSFFLGKEMGGSGWLMAGSYITLLGLSALFSGTETAIVSLKPYEVEEGELEKKVEEIVKDEKKKAHVLHGTLLGNNIVNTLLGSLSALIAPHLNLSPSTTALATMGILFFASEVLPKQVAMNHPKMWVKATSIFVWGAYLVGHSTAIIFNALSFLHKKDGDERQLVKNILSMMGERGVLHRKTSLYLSMALEEAMEEKTVKEWRGFIPIDMTAYMVAGRSYWAEVERIERLFGRTFSRYLVITEEGEERMRKGLPLRRKDVVGVFHAKDVKRKDQKVEVSGKPSFVDASTKVREALGLGKKMLVVVEQSLGEEEGDVEQVVGIVLLSSFSDYALGIVEGSDTAYHPFVKSLYLPRESSERS